MNFREYPLLNTPNLVAVLMRAAAEAPVSLDHALDRLEGLLAAEGRPPVSRSEIRRRLERLRDDLAIAGLLVGCDGGRFELTERGRVALREHPQGLARADLMAYPEYAVHVRARHARVGGSDDPRAGAFDEGFAAYHAGLTLDQNPYEADTVDHLGWENGWFEALDESDAAGGGPATG